MLLILFLEETYGDVVGLRTQSTDHAIECTTEGRTALYFLDRQACVIVSRRSLA